MSDLKPCPFCGGNQIQAGHVRDGRCIGCTSCGAVVRAYHPNAESNAREKWNTRATPTLSAAMELPDVRALVEALRHYACDCGDMCEMLNGTCGDTATAALAQFTEAKP
jgi:Lar family restriction alleviation protein